VSSRSRPGLTRERILRAALKLIDRDGIDMLSMRKLGRALGVEAMSLYRYVPNKDAVAGGVVELLLDELELAPAAPATGAPTPAGSWRSYRDGRRAATRSRPRCSRCVRCPERRAAVERAPLPARRGRCGKAGARRGPARSRPNGVLLSYRQTATACVSWPAPRAARVRGGPVFELGLRVILAGLDLRVSRGRARRDPAAAPIEPLRSRLDTTGFQWTTHAGDVGSPGSKDQPGWQDT
jgi:AcrR family transcriptional regulator